MNEENKKLKVALVHDHITQFGGAERVLHIMHNIFPEAPIYTLFYDKQLTDTYFASADIHTSFLQKFPGIFKKRFRYMAPFAIPAVENIDLQGYDIVVSSSSFFSKGVITGPDTLHISYCHTPTKYLWELKEPNTKTKKIQSPAKILEKIALHFFRIWDYNSAYRVDYFIANSKDTKKRIRKVYKRDSFIIYPSVTTDMMDNGSKAQKNETKEVLSKLPNNFFLIVSQLQDYKNIDLAVEAFSKMKYPLVIIGDGPQKKKLKKMASDNIYFLGWQPDNIVKECYKRCRAYIYPGKEDFGISAVEAMLFGKPVLAFKEGGVLESVIEGVSGEFFENSHPAVLAEGVMRLNKSYADYNTQMIQGIGNKFNKERFKGEFRRILKRILYHEASVS